MLYCLLFHSCLLRGAWLNPRVWSSLCRQNPSQVITPTIVEDHIRVCREILLQGSHQCNKEYQF